ncbi:hypothetical protein [Polluticaenibacter yanchengensis]|uniref:Uncharacterized protein n=1 Tax=Polluticaenibacter yanchengensis TaxID=3014562 RepID=A0ABT4UHY3_9BACT|nr:hypothetical protein [Chitinophagaceae bacterium LY-5]
MSLYKELKVNNYYIIQESENANLELVFVIMDTSKTLLLEFQDEDQNLRWVRKSDQLFDIVDKLTKEQAEEYENIFDDEITAEEDDFSSLNTVKDLEKAMIELKKKLDLLDELEDYADEFEDDDDDLDDDNDSDDDDDDDDDTDDRIIRMSKN